jgi:hypothetical protein
MSVWATRSFLASCDVDLDLKVYVGALQLRSVRAGSFARSGGALFGGDGAGGDGGGDGDVDVDVDDASALSECSLSLQVVDGGVPLHAFARSTGMCAAGDGPLRGRLAFGEWVCLPVRVRDLPQTAQLVVRLWGSGNECLGGATLRVFDPLLALRRGLQVRLPARRAARRSPLHACRVRHRRSLTARARAGARPRRRALNPRFRSRQ